MKSLASTRWLLQYIKSKQMETSFGRSGFYLHSSVSFFVCLKLLYYLNLSFLYCELRYMNPPKCTKYPCWTLVNWMTIWNLCRTHSTSMFGDQNLPWTMHETPILCQTSPKTRCKQNLLDKLKKHTKKFVYFGVKIRHIDTYWHP